MTEAKRSCNTCEWVRLKPAGRRMIHRCGNKVSVWFEQIVNPDGSCWRWREMHCPFEPQGPDE